MEVEWSHLSKSNVRSRREAQRLADTIMEEVNEKNNTPQPASSAIVDVVTDNNSTAAIDKKFFTLSQLKERSMELSWPLLKKSTRDNYEYFFQLN